MSVERYTKRVSSSTSFNINSTVRVLVLRQVFTLWPGLQYSDIDQTSNQWAQEILLAQSPEQLGLQALATVSS